MTRLQHLFLAVAMALVLFQAAPKATYTCYGAVVTLAVSPSGLVSATVGSLSYAYICNITATFNGVSADACKGIYASLLAAKLNAQTVGFTFDDSLSCTSHPAWATLTGWYYGPELQP